MSRRTSRAQRLVIKHFEMDKTHLLHAIHVHNTGTARTQSLVPRCQVNDTCKYFTRTNVWSIEMHSLQRTIHSLQTVQIDNKRKWTKDHVVLVSSIKLVMKLNSKLSRLRAEVVEYVCFYRRLCTSKQVNLSHCPSFGRRWNTKRWSKGVVIYLLLPWF